MNALRCSGSNASAHVVLNSEGKPYPYRQPAMREPLAASNEVPLWLMVLPFHCPASRT